MEVVILNTAGTVAQYRLNTSTPGAVGNIFNVFLAGSILL